MNFKKLLAVCLTVVTVASALSPTALGAQSNTEATLPTAYSSKDMGYITAVKNQGTSGLCWAFSAVACAEADAIKNHGAALSDTNLSEWHLAYFAYHGDRIGTDDSVFLDSSVPYYKIGGFDMLSLMTLSSGIGFADEAVAPYDTEPPEYGVEISLDKMYECKYKIDNIFFYDIVSEPDKIKEAIMEYGAVAASYYGDTEYFNASASAQYCEKEYSADHSITIVGWNDGYDRNNFKKSFFDRTIPSYNGAWLVKNSWGEDFGDGGYFWLSYEDATITGGTVYDVSPADNYNNIYQHDGGASMLSLENSLDTAIANAFVTEKRHELLEAVGINAAIDADSAPYRLDIYINPPAIDDGVFGEPAYTQTGNLRDGYNTVILDRGLELEQGDVFIVSVSADAEIMVDGASDVDMGSGIIYRSFSNVGKNETFYRGESGKWYDISERENPWNARIKAYTEELFKSDPYLDAPPVISPMVYGQSLEEASIIGGSVKAAVDGEPLSGTWSFSNPKLVPKNGDEVKIVFTPDESLSYAKLRLTVKAIVSSVTPTATISFDKERYSSGERVNVSVKLCHPEKEDMTVTDGYSLYYSIDGGEKIQIFDNSFTLPDNAKGVVKIYLEYQGETGSYTPLSAETEFSVERDSFGISDIGGFDAFSDISISGSLKYLVIGGVIIAAVTAVVLIPVLCVAGIAAAVIAIATKRKKAKTENSED